VTVIIDGGFGFHVGFIDHFKTRLGTTSNYSAIAFYTSLQHTLFTSLLYIHQPFPDNGFKSVDSSVSALNSTLNGSSLTTVLTSKRVSVITSQLRPTEATAVYCCSNLFRGNVFCL
jgi:hypothetical protein